MVKKFQFLQNPWLNGLMKSLIFRLSKWQQPLLDLYEKNPNFISPGQDEMRL